MAESLISPLEALVTPDPKDFCGCLHFRDDHITGDDGQPVCVLCRHAQVSPIAFPWHGFHLTYPRHLPADTPVELAFYQPPPGWDVPVFGTHSA